VVPPEDRLSPLYVSQLTGEDKSLTPVNGLLPFIKQVFALDWLSITYNIRMGGDLRKEQNPATSTIPCQNLTALIKKDGPEEYLLRRIEVKISVIGIGQCGCNIADQFWNINNYSKSFFGRGIEIIVDAFAVNTDETDLTGIRHIPRDKSHRIVVGTARTYGHGVGKINVDGARIMKEAYPVIVDAVLSSRKYHEGDATVVVASGAGGTGSGGIGWVIKGLKERVEKPVYAIVVMPFAYEEKGENSYAVTNTATCLKTVIQNADAVFLLDNERFAKSSVGISANLLIINEQMVKNFFDLFCAGEEQKSKYVGSKVIDAGDIKQSLEHLCTIGRGEVPLTTFYAIHKDSFKEAARESIGAVGALGLALNNLSLRVNVEDAEKILVIISGPRDVSTLSVMGELSNSMQERAPNSIVRIGDYPRRANEISVTIVLSKLTKVPKVEDLFTRADALLKKREELEKEANEKIQRMYRASDNIPSLDK
jgi:cell division GTPase FtsZ